MLDWVDRVFFVLLGGGGVEQGIGVGGAQRL